jgi:hypothetical protein
MADSKNNDTVDGFDFREEDFNWGNDEGAATSASSSSSASAVSSASLGDDPFSAANDDDGFGGNESFYSLEQMPDADGQDTFAELGGDDFGDIKTDDQPVTYDFGAEPDELPAGRVITDAPTTYDEVEDPFNTSYQPDQGDEESIDPFAVPDAADAANPADGAAPAEPKKSSKLVTYAMAAAASVVAVGGIFYVMPSFLGGDAPVDTAQVQPAQGPAEAFPAALPTQSTAQPEITPATDVAPTEIAQATPPVLAGSATPPAAEAVPTPPALDIPELPTVEPTPPAIEADKPTLALPQAPVGTVEDPKLVIPEKEDPFKDLVGGKERGGIDAMKGDAPAAVAAAPTAPSGEVAALSARLDALEGKVDRLSDSFDNYVQTTVKAAEPTPAAPIVAAAVGDVTPPMKPPIIEGVSLKGVAGDVAWISTKSGVVEVKSGDEVPNGGKVVSFRNYRGDWIVVTTDGLIVRQ